jgi:hypothetical protein
MNMERTKNLQKGKNVNYRREKKLVQFWCTVFGVSAIVALFSVAASAQAPSTIFQLNGDPASNGSTCAYGTTTATCDYWNLINGNGSVLSGTGVGHSALNVFIPGSSNTFNFTTGGSKDPSPISSWAYATTGTPNKDTLNAAYAAAYNISDLDIIFGADRASPSGNANIGIWFFQDNVTLNSAGRFNGAHRNGDVFVISAFTSGGGTSTISVYAWDQPGLPNAINGGCTTGVKNPTVGQCADANLLLLASPSTVCGTSDYCAVTNGSSVSASWASYSGGSLASPLFFEGGVDITAAFAAVGGTRPCFASFMEETRSSASTSSVLKDFLLGRFPVCSMGISKACGTPSSSNGALTFPVSGIVTNTGIGTLYGVQVKDCINGPNGSCTAISPINIVNNTTGSLNLGTTTLAAHETGMWSASSSSTSSSQSDQAYALAAESLGGLQTLQSTNTALANCSLSINPTATVSKSCSTTLTGTSLTACDAGPEGSTVTYTVAITNTSSSGEIVDQICDSAYGNVFTAAGFAGAACPPGSAGVVASSGCSALNIPPSAIGTCTFTALHLENTIVTDTVSSSGHSSVLTSSTFSTPGSNSVTVTSSDAPSTATVTKGFDSTQAGCATVRYTVGVHNSSGSDEALSLSALNDDKYGSILSLHDSVLGTTCGVDTSVAGLGTLSGSSGAGLLPTTLPVGGSDYTCKFDAQFCSVGALGTITKPDGTTCLGLHHVNKVTATLAGDEGEAVSQTGNTFTVNECFASFVTSTTP